MQYSVQPRHSCVFASLSLALGCAAYFSILRRIRSVKESTGSIIGSRIVVTHDTNEHTRNEGYVYIRRYDDDTSSVLKSMMAKDWVYDRPIVSLSDDENAADALRTMHDTGSSCALIYKGPTLIGVLDLLDVVRYMLRGCVAEDISVRKMVRICTIGGDGLNLNDICQHLKTGARHVAITKEHRHTIVSQRSLVQALYHVAAHNSELESKFAIMLKDLGLPSHNKVITIESSSTALDAFQKMAAYDITSILVTKDSTAHGVISSTDILYARLKTDLLSLNVMDYITESRRDAQNKRSAETVICCSPNDKLHDAVSLMLTNNVHHIYVLDEEDKPTAVVSFVDVIRKM